MINTQRVREEGKLFGLSAPKWALVLLMLLALLLRLSGIFSELWLDEIWWLEIVRELTSPTEIFTKLRDVGNHHLYSSYLYLVRESDLNWLLRIPSLLFGVLTIPLIYCLDRSTPTGKISLAALLLTFSALFTLYSSEARGYAAVVFFSLFSLHILERAKQENQRLDVVLFSLVLILGVLSQLIFILWIGILFIYAFYLFYSRRERCFGTLQLLKLFVVPALFITALYLFCMQDLSSTSGSVNSIFGTLMETSLVAFAGQTLKPSVSSSFVFAPLLLLLIPIVALIEINHQRKEGERRWLLYFLSFVLFPLIAWMASGLSPVYPRYFLILVALSYLLFASFLRRLEGRNRKAAFLTYALITLFILSNLLNIGSIVRYGRGDYSAALRRVAELDSNSFISISGDHALRHAKLITFYGAKISGKQFEYLPENQVLKSKPPHWYFMHFEDPGWIPAKEIHQPFGDYELDSIYLFSGILSGWNLGVYKLRL